jgi:superfamily II DNA or RNA helicase/HKD family nuclease
MNDPGPRDELLTSELAQELAELPAELIDREPLDPIESSRRLATHVAKVVERRLRGTQSSTSDMAELVNVIVDGAERLIIPPEVLTGIRRPAAGLDSTPPAIIRPATPFGTSDLLVNAEGQPNIGSELRAELATAARVDLLCAFVIWSGVVQLRDALRSVIERGGRIRVITTTYMGATEPRAVEELVRLGAEVKVAFDARTTKLHAKAWLLERPADMATAFIGSSNLSHTALFDGLEWNVRLSTTDAAHVIDRVRAMFESHWASPHFELFDPGRDAERLERALGTHNQRELGTSVSFAGLDVRPYPHQERMLEQLTIERVRHDRHRNLVVAATGTGKTVVAALDYRQLCAGGEPPSLLFVAHREQILNQSLATFRAVMRDGSFGEIHGGGKLARGKHVFAMVQSLGPDALERIGADDFEVVVVDEFHHASAPTYRRLLARVEPRELVGLTATPERLDGQDVTEYFDGRVAVELRLWEAIDEGFLVPFQYFGVADDVDLSRLQWSAGGYRQAELNEVMTGNHARVAKLLESLRRVVLDPGRMRALGFCVSVEHAHFMAEQFTQAGLESRALDGATPQDERAATLNSLARGALRCVFSVDVLGEGVDVPAVDTVLLLRPTDSATVFTQQLGRGLRRSQGKAHLTVIDLIGQQRREFRFDQRLRALLDIRRGAVQDQVEQGFPFLPSGCHLELDRQSEAIVLNNLRDAARLTQWRTLVSDLRGLGDVGLEVFLERTAREPFDVYRSAGRGWTALRRDAALPTQPAPSSDTEEGLLRAIRRMLHVEDPERVRFYREVLAASRPPSTEALDERQRRLLLMLHFDLWGSRGTFRSLDEAYRALWPFESVRAELQELLSVLDGRSQQLPIIGRFPPEIPLGVHAAYTRDEILAAYGQGDAQGPPQLREGVKFIESASTDLFFVTLRKSDRDYSPTTIYRDYAISRELFHWESQATQSETSPTIRRYREHENRNHSIVLFVREKKSGPGGTTPPYTCLGSARYVESRGSRPVAFTWRLDAPMPEALFEHARSVAAA